MQLNITLTVNTDTLRSVEDSHLHALWHVAQINPAPLHDRDACELVADITAEIVRRWLKSAPTERYTHQPTNHHWHTLQQHGNWRGKGGTWLPYDGPASIDGADACTASTSTNSEQERA